MPFGLKPLVVDVSATFEPQSGYHMTPGVEVKFEPLRRRYRRWIFMGSLYGGNPKLFTKPRGMSASARIEVGRRMWRRSRLEAVLTELFPLFLDLPAAGISSGPLDVLKLSFSPRPDDDLPLLAMVEAAFAAVFGDMFGHDCVFLISGHVYQIGKAKAYEPLVDYVRGVGPYNAVARRSIEDLVEHVGKERGTFEDVRLWVSVSKDDLGPDDPIPPVYYSCRHPRTDVETMVREKWERPVRHLTEEEAEQREEDLVELRDYILASRTRGTVWVKNGRVVRTVGRDYLPVMEAMLPPSSNHDAGPQEWFGWDELVDRVQRSPKISRANAQSSTFLEKALAGLTGAELVRERDDEYALAADFHTYEHVRYYSLGRWPG